MALGSCTLAKNQLMTDRAVSKDRQDYRDILSPRPGEMDAALDGKKDAPVPEFQSVVSTPTDLKLPAPLVTVSVNQTVGLRDLIFELADKAGVDVEIDPQVKGSIIFTAKERPFNEVVDRICELAGLRYKYEDNKLRVEVDRPYLKTYKINYIAGSRKGESKVSMGVTTSGSGDAGGATQEAKLGSEAQIETKFDGDFWKDLEDGLKQLLVSSDVYTPMTTGEDPIAVPEMPPPQMPVAAAVPPAAPGAAPAGGLAPATPALPPATVPPSLNVSTPPASGAGGTGKAAATYSISKQSGIVSVYATDRQQKLVAHYFENYGKQSMTQVLIEARVLQVELNDEFANGVDWTKVVNLTGMMSLTGTFPTALENTGGALFQGRFNLGKDFGPVLSALSRFGTVRSLSSPRVTVLNNQPALMNVATNLIYFTVEVTAGTPASQNGPGTAPTYESTQHTVPEGVLLTVTPTADAVSGELVLSVRPTISRKVSDALDPAPVLAGFPADLNKVPVMQVQEIDSLIRMQSGQTLVMGGLMRDSGTGEEVGAPILGDVPLIGAVFRSHNDSIKKSELVIFIKATVLPGSNIDEQDRRLYRNFAGDTHPTTL